MRWNILATLALHLISIPVVLGQEPPKHANLEGVILRAGAGIPVANAKVTLAPIVPTTSPAPAERGNLAPRPIPPAVTNDKGRFSFSNLDPGSYRLQVQANGYVPQKYGQVYPGGSEAPITLIAGQSKTDADITLTPAGNVSGRILDRNDQPVESVPVQLLRSAFDSDGRRHLDAIETTLTNDRGEYRFYWVTPGRYLLKAGMNSALASVLVAMDGSRRGGNPNILETDAGVAYYPGAPALSDARTIEVPPGSDLTGIDWTVPPRPTGRRVTVQIIDGKTGQQPTDAEVMLIPLVPGFSTGDNTSDPDQKIFAMQNGQGHAYNPKTGRAVFGNIPPGNYTAAAQTVSFVCADGSAPIKSGDGARRCGKDEKNGKAPIERLSLGWTVLTVGDSDIENATLTIDPSGTITGRLRTDSGPFTPPQDFSGRPKEYVVQLRDARGSGNHFVWNPGTPVEADGTFRMDSVVAGEFRLVVSGLPPNTFVQSARLDGIDILSAPAVFSHAPSGTLDIVVGSNGGEVQGRLVNEKSEPVAHERVVLVPRSRTRIDLYKTATADAEGHFALTGIPPGDYKLFSWQGLDLYDWFDAALLERSETRGVPIHTSESTTETAEVRIIPEDNDR